MNSQPLIVLRDLTLKRASKVILEDANAELNPGEVVGLVGPNGVGKTTLLSAIIGDLPPQFGEVTVMGQNIFSVPDRSHIFGILTASYTFPPSERVRKALANLKRLFRVDSERFMQLVEFFAVHEFAHKSLNDLSTGMRKRFDLLVATLTDAPILLLDEPTNGLDLEAVQMLREFMKQQRQQGKLVVIASHLFAELDLVADRVLGLMDGKLQECTAFEPGVRGSAEEAYVKLKKAGDTK